MKSTTVHELQSMLAGGQRLDLIDVRTPAEFAGIHVPGARSAPLDDLDCAATLAEHNRSKYGSPLYILCHSGTRAAKAAEKFAAIGFDEYAVVEGGTQAWAEAGLPVERGARAVLPLDRQLQIAIGTLVLIAVLLAQFLHPAWIWLAGVVGCGLIFAGLSGICALRIVIARMPWNQSAPKKASCCCAG
jgi:rhodanese-related sulfurtransferase